jgi:hypothetical protein
MVIPSSDPKKSTSLTLSCTRRQHRKIAMRLLTPKAIEGYASVLNYKAHMLVRSLYNETRQREVPIDLTKLVGRYVIK